MPDKNKRRYATEEISRRTERRRKRISKKAGSEISAEKIRQGTPGGYATEEGRQGSREQKDKKYKSKSGSYVIGGEKGKTTYYKPEPGEPEIAHKKTGEKRYGETEKVFEGKESKYDVSQYPGRLSESQKKELKERGEPTMERTATSEEGGDKVRITEKMKYPEKPIEPTRGTGFEPQETISGKVRRQKATREGAAKPTKESMATLAGYTSPDVYTKVKTKGKRKLGGMEAKSKKVTKVKTYSHDKPTDSPAPFDTGWLRKDDEEGRQPKYITQTRYKEKDKGRTKKMVEKTRTVKNPEWGGKTVRGRRRGLSGYNKY